MRDVHRQHLGIFLLFRETIYIYIYIYLAQNLNLIRHQETDIEEG